MTHQLEMNLTRASVSESEARGKREGGGPGGAGLGKGQGEGRKGRKRRGRVGGWRASREEGCATRGERGRSALEEGKREKR